MSFRPAVAFLTWLVLVGGCVTNAKAEDFSSVQRQRLAQIDAFSSTPNLPERIAELKLSNGSRDGSASGQEPALLEAPQSGLKPDFVPAVILSVTRLGLKTDVPEGTTSITLDPGSYRVELLGSDNQITTVNVPLEAGKRHQVAYRVLSDKSIRPVLYRVLPTRSGPSGVFATSPDMPDSLRAVGAELVSTGTAFYISSEGHLITNNHVVAQCTYIRVQLPNGSVEASLQAASKLDDLAVLHTAISGPKTIAKFRPTAVLLGEDVLVAGYPLSGLLSSSLNVTTGSISSLAGLVDDRRLFQFTAPIQAGNSGGPILDESGQVLGVVTSTLNPLLLARDTGNIPQNVNFGIKAAVVRAFLEVHDFVPPLGSEKSRPQTRVMLAKQAGDFTVLVECWR